jgi:hypothetical protein
MAMASGAGLTCCAGLLHLCAHGLCLYARTLSMVRRRA